MAIIGTLPNTISNGQAVDATPVMADFNFIVNQVNANANPLGNLTAPGGTSMAFQQATAPLGWVAQTAAAFTDAFLRCVTPSVFANLGGANAATSLFIGPFTTDGHALTIGEMPSHNHPASDSGHSHSSPAHAHGTASGFSFWTATPTGGATTNFVGGGNNINLETQTNPVGVTINTGFANVTTSAVGSGNVHTHTLNPNCKFVDQIIAVKS